MTLEITAFDAFCGAGGSSTGLVKAGIEVRFAANHWQLAIETHNTNHPDTEHDIADLQATHPSTTPKASWKNKIICAIIRGMQNGVMQKTSPPSLTSFTKGIRAMATSDSITKKCCTQCGIEKPFSEFHKHKLGVYGLNPKCKACRSRATPKPPVAPGMKRCTQCKTEYLPTTEFFAPSQKQSSGLRPECRVCQNERTAVWREKNKDILNQKARERHAKNPDLRNGINRRSEAKNPIRIREIKRESAIRNPRPKDKVLAKQARRQAMKRQLPASFTAEDWNRALSYFEGRCAVCGNPPGLWTRLAADHWIAISDPRSDNPGTVPWNIVPLCHAKKGVPAGEPSCNVSKDAHDPIEWLYRRYNRKEADAILANINRYFEMVKGVAQS